MARPFSKQKKLPLLRQQKQTDGLFWTKNRYAQYAIKKPTVWRRSANSGIQKKDVNVSQRYKKWNSNLSHLQILPVQVAGQLLMAVFLWTKTFTMFKEISNGNSLKASGFLRGRATPRDTKHVFLKSIGMRFFLKNLRLKIV